VNIWLDVPMNTIPSSEAIDLMESKNHLHQANLQSVTLSPGMRLVINQTLVEVMGGKLEIFPSQIAKELPQEFTRIQISIPVSSSADAL
jgi:hypothetical protein